METILLQLSMYSLFDRLGDGISFEYKATYDWPSILANDFNETNFVLSPVGFSDEAKRYFKRYKISAKEWEEEAMQAVNRRNRESAREVFFETVQDGEDRVDAYLSARQKALE